MGLNVFSPTSPPYPLGNRLDLSPATEARIALDVAELATKRYAAADEHLPRA